MKKLVFAAMLGLMVSYMSAFDVCAGDFFDRYEDELKNPRGDSCFRCLNVEKGNRFMVFWVSEAYEYYAKYSKLCNPNTKMKMRKMFFDDLLREAMEREKSRCETYYTSPVRCDKQ